MLYYKKGLMTADAIKYTPEYIRSIFYENFKAEMLVTVKEKLSIDKEEQSNGDRKVEISMLAIVGKKNIHRMSELFLELTDVFTICDNKPGLQMLQELHHLIHH